MPNSCARSGRLSTGDFERLGAVGLLRSAPLLGAESVGDVARMYDGAERAVGLERVPWIERQALDEVGEPAAARRGDVRRGKVEARHRQGRRVGLAPGDGRVLDRCSAIVDEQLDADVEVNERVAEAPSEILGEVIDRRG